MVVGKNRTRKTRGPYAKRACIHCKQAKAKCDNFRPCRRCIKNGLSHECVDALRTTKKKRKRKVKKKQKRTINKTYNEHNYPNLQKFLPYVPSNSSTSSRKKAIVSTSNNNGFKVQNVSKLNNFSNPIYIGKQNYVPPINLIGMDKNFKSISPVVLESSTINQIEDKDNLDDDKNKQIALHQDHLYFSPPSPLPLQSIDSGNFDGDFPSVYNPSNRNNDIDLNFPPFMDEDEIIMTNSRKATSNDDDDIDLFIDLDNINENNDFTQKYPSPLPLPFSNHNNDFLDNSKDFDTHDIVFNDYDELPQIKEYPENENNFNNITDGRAVGENDKLFLGNGFNMMNHSQDFNKVKKNGPIMNQYPVEKKSNLNVNKNDIDLSEYNRGELEEMYKSLLNYVNKNGNKES